MLFWIYDYPSWQMAIVFMIVFAAASILGLFLFRQLFNRRLHRDPRTNEMVGFAMSSFSMLYGLLLGMLAVTASQGFSDTSALATRESSVIAALYRASSALPDPAGSDLEKILRTYSRHVIDIDWPAQRAGRIPDEESPLIDVFFDRLHAFEPASMREQTIQAEALTLGTELIETRRARLSSIDGGIPAILWWVVLAGALVNLMLLWMLDMSLRTHIVLTALIGSFLGLVIFLIAAFDHPFRGDISVTAEPYEYVYRALMLAPR